MGVLREGGAAPSRCLSGLPPLGKRGDIIQRCVLPLGRLQGGGAHRGERLRFLRSPALCDGGERLCESALHENPRREPPERALGLRVRKESEPLLEHGGPHEPVGSLQASECGALPSASSHISPHPGAADLLLCKASGCDTSLPSPDFDHGGLLQLCDLGCRRRHPL